MDSVTLWSMTTPVMWSTVFIIDPVYTLPLLVAVIWVAGSPDVTGISKPLLAALALSSAYLGWTWVAKLSVERTARDALATLDLAPLQTSLPELGLVRGPDGYYLSRRDGAWGERSKSTILHFDPSTQKTRQPAWAIPERDESDFYYSPEREMACFVSDRASGQFAPNDDIWCMTWLGDGWDEAVPMPPPINSEAVEYSPVIRPNGDIYFASDRAGGAGQGDIYRAWPTNDGWSVERLGRAINSAGGEWNLEISPDGGMMIFEASQRTTNRTAAGDLYLSWWTGSGWSHARPIDSLNTDGSDLMARFIDDQTIVYASSIGSDVELRKTNRAELERTLPPP